MAYKCFMQIKNGHDLKVERVKANVKAFDVAAAMGVHHSTVSRIESRWYVEQEVINRYLAALATCSTNRTSGEAA